jgi:pentapeptide MXKDX repeat protein
MRSRIAGCIPMFCNPHRCTEGNTMNKLNAAVLAACLYAAAGVHAADEMKKDSMGGDAMMKKDAMGKDDAMTKKDAMMKKDAMHKDGMMKKGGMKGDPAAKNEGPTREEMKR